MVRPRFLDRGPVEWTGEGWSDDRSRRKLQRVRDTLTSWTVVDVTLRACTILSKLAGWPLLVTPEARKLEPIGPLRGFTGSSGSSTGRNDEYIIRRCVPEASEIQGDVPQGPLICLVFQNIEWNVFVVMVA